MLSDPLAESMRDAEDAVLNVFRESFLQVIRRIYISQVHVTMAF